MSVSATRAFSIRSSASGRGSSSESGSFGRGSSARSQLQYPPPSQSSKHWHGMSAADERPDVRPYALLQSLDVVAAFEHADDRFTWVRVWVWVWVSVWVWVNGER